MPSKNLNKAKKSLDPIKRFSQKNFKIICDQLAEKDADLQAVILQYGYPSMWTRIPNFETLIHIILEQQVSLASALAALQKLKEKLGQITPVKLLLLTDIELKACYFSRQKIIYARHLAQSIIAGELQLHQLGSASDETVRAELKKIKGIGDWTSDVYLMMALQRADLFPIGDIALVNSLKEVKNLPKHASKETILQLAEQWKPYRTIAAFLLWHAYLSKRNTKT
jgi:DNA-3-methyladenine glycosylase II